jgi:hypothetical protein
VQPFNLVDNIFALLGFAEFAVLDLSNGIINGWLCVIGKIIGYLFRFYFLGFGFGSNFV